MTIPNSAALIAIVLYLSACSGTGIKPDPRAEESKIESKQDKVRHELASMGRASEVYREHYGKWPGEEMQFFKDLRAFSKYPVPDFDPWGSRYHVLRDGDDFLIASYGPDIDGMDQRDDVYWHSRRGIKAGKWAPR